MIVQLICPDCNGFGMDESMGPQDIFWVECRYDEAVKVVMPWVKSKQTEKAEKIAAEIERNYRLLSEKPGGKHTNNLWKKGCVYFLISRRLDLIKPMAHYFPYSGMWNAYNPFRKIFPQMIYGLEEVPGIVAEPLNIKELPTWAGRSKFCYFGSVERGVIIQYGTGREVKMLPSQFAEMFWHFSGRIVNVGASRTDPDEDSLENWLNGRINKTAIATYVASILEAEGLAYRVEERSKIRFISGIRLELDYESVKAYQEPVVGVKNPITGREKVFQGIDGKILRRLENNGRVLFKRVPM